MKIRMFDARRCELKINCLTACGVQRLKVELLLQWHAYLKYICRGKATSAEPADGPLHYNGVLKPFYFKTLWHNEVIHLRYKSVTSIICIIT